MRQRFVTAQWIPYTVDQAFPFFANPANLPLLTPERMRMRIDKLALVPAPLNPMITEAQLGKQEIAAGTDPQGGTPDIEVGSAYLPGRRPCNLSGRKGTMAHNARRPEPPRRLNDETSH